MGMEILNLKIMIEKWRNILYSYSYFLYIEIKTCIFYSHNSDIDKHICLYYLQIIKI